MKIQEVCRQTELTKRNIHFYIKEGLITPATNPENGYYDFSEEDVAKLLFIREMRNADLSLPVIKSMMSNPLSSGYYLNRQIKRLKKEQRRMEQTLISMQYILDGLSFYPDFSTLNRLCQEAGIPKKLNDLSPDEEFDTYSTTIINLFLWGGFLPEEKFTEYQEFLWMKLNRITLEQPSEEYRRLGKTLRLIDDSMIGKMFYRKDERYLKIASLKEEDIPAFVEDMILQLEAMIKNPSYVRFWNNYYYDFFQPNTAIQASELSRLMCEISPLFMKYVSNVTIALNQCYDYLHSDQGISLLQSLQEAFGENLNLEVANHGELEALVSVPSFYHTIR